MRAILYAASLFLSMVHENHRSISFSRVCITNLTLTLATIIIAGNRGSGSKWTKNNVSDELRSVKATLHRQSGLRCGRRNQLQDHRVALVRLAAPVLADPGKETMLDLVPFAGPWRQVADRDAQTCLIGQLLQFPFPQASP